MPLPDRPTQSWPPKHTLPCQDHLEAWSAWYSGEPDDLARVYGDVTGAAIGSRNRAASGFFQANRPGVRGMLTRWFWGAPVPNGEERTKLHIPVASDIAAISADLLFAEPPGVTVPDGNDATAEQVEAYVEDGLWTNLREAAEVGSAMGGVFLRVVWDDSVRERPWLTASSPEMVVPEWKWDQLAAATFWRLLESDGRTVVRHLERHEPGRILHGVYVGTRDELGRRAALTDFPETEDLAVSLTAEDVIETGITQLTAGYIPNVRPNRIWRGHPELANYGRSDFSGVEGLFDAIDETMSSLMRDVRLGKARIIVPNSALQSFGRGKGATFDLDQELITGLDLGPGGPQSAGDIREVQFKIRVEEHLTTLKDLTETAIRDAGYSMQTLSGTGDVAMTATEVASRERRSLLTRGRKVQYNSPVLRDMLEALLAIDAVKFGPDGVQPATVRLEWPKWVFVDPMDTASTVQLLRDAQVVSQETALRMLHPDWDDEEIQKERARLVLEQSGSVVDLSVPVDAPDLMDDQMSDVLDEGM